MSEGKIAKKSSGGRPAIGSGEQIRSSWREEEVVELEAWIARQSVSRLRKTVAARKAALLAIRAGLALPAE